MMFKNKYKCPICGAVSTPIMWMEETASYKGAQYRNIVHIDKNITYKHYVCPECKESVKRNKIELVPVAVSLRKKLFKQIMPEVRSGIESLRISLNQNGTSYLFTFDRSEAEPTATYDDDGQPKLFTFNVGDITLPVVTLKDGSKNIDHQHSALVGGMHLVASYSVTSDRVSYTIQTENGENMYNIGEMLQQYEAKIAAIQGTQVDTSPMVGIFTKDDRYVEHCSDCPERYSCASAELRYEYRR